MKVTQEKLPASQIGLQIEISADTTKQTYEKVVKNLLDSSNIPGFRKGKVPRQVLFQRYGTKRIKAAALEEIIQTSLQQALETEKITPIGENYKLRTDFETLIEAYEPGKTLEFSAAVEVAPEVNIVEYVGLQIKAEETPYDPLELENFLKEKQETKVVEVPVEDRGAEIGDLAYIDYAIFVTDEAGQPGEKMPGMEGKDFRVEMDEEKFIPGFIAGIVGMKPEESKELPLTFPEDYGSQELAGKPVVFSITVKEIKAKELPALDDELAKQISEFETMEALRHSLEEEYKEKAAQQTNSSIGDAILAELVAKNPLDLPETLIQEEVNNVLTQTAMQIQQFGIELKQFFTPESIPKMRERARPEAITNITQGLIVAEIAKREGITPDPEAMEKRYQEVIQQLKGKDLDRDRLKDILTKEQITEKTLLWLREKSTVELVPKGSLSPEKEEDVKEPETDLEASEEQTTSDTPEATTTSAES